MATMIVQIKSGRNTMFLPDGVGKLSVSCVVLYEPKVLGQSRLYVGAVFSGVKWKSLI
jgi:hypothetical protein